MTNKKPVSIVLTGGGTGGHVYPAVAVGEALKQDSEIKNIYYIGCSKNLEKEIVSKLGIKFYSINISGMPRTFGFKKLSWCIQLFTATLDSIFYLLRLRPNVVFGTGGYVTGPVLLAALFLRIPYVLHDPDARPGIVNKFMSKWAKFVSLSFEEGKKYIKNPNAKVYGNPIRESLKNIEKKSAINELGLIHEKKTVLIIGGSQGAKAINEAVMDLMPVLIKDYGFQVIHQTGKKNFDEYITMLYEKYPSLKDNFNCIVKPYFDDMALPLAAADLAISRAGSLSLSELNYCGIPSILIPYPHSAADHQRFNAKAVEKAGAGFYLEEKDCSSEKLLGAITSILTNVKNHLTMKQVNESLAKHDSAANIITEIKKAVQ